MPVEPAHVARMRELVASGLGLELNDDADERLATILGQRVSERRTTPAQYLDALDAGELHALGQQLTIGETYFFRMRAHFDALREHAATKAGPLSVLSAGCSTGEEAYTIAITLRTRGVASSVVQAVDLNRRSLDIARRAVYSEWALRAVAAADRDRWFNRQGKRWELRPEIRSLVELRQGNLIADDAIPLGPFDAIFCRNVIMYFTRDAQRTAIARLSAALRTGGLLFLGHAETLRGVSTEYAIEQHGDAFHYRHLHRSDRAAPPRPTIKRKTPATAWVESAPPEPPAVPAPDVLALIAAEKFAEALAAIDPGPSVLRATALLGTGNVDAAEELCTHLVTLDQGGAEPHYVLGLAAESRGDRPTAIDRHRAAIYLEPDFALAHLQVGRLERREGEVERARRDLRRAVELLGHEQATRIALFGGGFGREALLALARAEARRDRTDRVSDRAKDLAEAFDRSFAEANRLDGDRGAAALAIRVGADAYVLRLDDVAHVGRSPRIVALPNPRAIQLGIAGVRGSLVTVFSLAALLGGDATRSQHGWIASLARHRGMALAFDAVDGQLAIATGAHPPNIVDVTAILQRAGVV